MLLTFALLALLCDVSHNYQAYWGWLNKLMQQQLEHRGPAAVAEHKRSFDVYQQQQQQEDFFPSTSSTSGSVESDSTAPSSDTNGLLPVTGPPLFSSSSSSSSSSVAPSSTTLGGSSPKKRRRIAPMLITSEINKWWSCYHTTRALHTLMHIIHVFYELRCQPQDSKGIPAGNWTGVRLNLYNKKTITQYSNSKLLSL